MNDPHQPSHSLTHPARARRNPPLSRQASALRKLVLVFAGLSVLVLGATAYAYIIHRHELSADHIRQITEAAGIKCNDFFLPVWSTASVIRQWGESGILSENKIATLNAKLLPLLEQVPHIQAMRIVSPEGRLIYGLMRHDGHWAACLVPETDGKSPKMTWQFYERNGAEMKGQFKSGPPDPLTRQRWAEARDQSATYPARLDTALPPFPHRRRGDECHIRLDQRRAVPHLWLGFPYGGYHAAAERNQSYRIHDLFPLRPGASPGRFPGNG
jgi:hypothetical protein